MLDLICIVVTATFFAVGVALTRACESLEKEEK
jgi:hypothetical protein